MRCRLAAAVVVLAAVSACGGTTTPSSGPTRGSQPPSTAPTTTTPTTPATTPATTPTAAVLPKCSQVWVVGRRLPARYSGCRDGGRTVGSHGRQCVVGHDLVVYRHRFFAMTTGKIFEGGDLASDHDYRLITQLCKHGTPVS